RLSLPGSETKETGCNCFSGMHRRRQHPRPTNWWSKRREAFSRFRSHCHQPPSSSTRRLRGGKALADPLRNNFGELRSGIWTHNEIGPGHHGQSPTEAVFTHTLVRSNQDGRLSRFFAEASSPPEQSALGPEIQRRQNYAEAGQEEAKE